VEEHYKGYIVVVTARDDSKYRWKPICAILSESTRTLIKDLEWILAYDSCDHTDRVGLLVSKK